LSKAEEAKKQFEKGVHYAPAVLSTYSEGLGLDKILAFKDCLWFWRWNRAHGKNLRICNRSVDGNWIEARSGEFG